MKIIITERQLKKLIKLEETLNESWYDDLVDTIKSKTSDTANKVKSKFKEITGIDFDKKDDKKIKKEIPSKDKIENEIEKLVGGDNKKGTTVVIGGMRYANASWMESQWKMAGLPTTNVVFINYTDSSKFNELKKEKNVTKIMGFSAGGKLIWQEINNNPSEYDFIGLIDPSTSKVYTKLPSNVYSLSNSANWGGYPKIKSILSQMEKSGTLDKTSKAHDQIPLEFFRKYKNKLS